MREFIATLLIFVACSAGSLAHDIPNARVDRSIQVTIRGGRLEIDYEVSLSELTLTQDLKSLVGKLEGGDRQAWFATYGRETGPMNAKGVLVTVDGNPIALVPGSFDLKVEEHPRYTFHFTADLPARGRLTIQDTNFAGSEGTSRLAVRGRDGISIRGDELPGNVDEIAIRPIWQLSDDEERRSKRVTVEYGAGDAVGPGQARSAPARVRSALAAPTKVDRLSGLLDRSSGLSLVALSLLALGLGAAHAIQPGHGKTLVAATVVGEGGSWIRGTILAVVTTLTHTGSVLLVAIGLWWTNSSRFAQVHIVLMHGAGFVIAVIGCWRLGRHLAGLAEHGGDHSLSRHATLKDVLALGVAGGLVPCWDAVGLILLAEAVGRLALGIALLVAFGLGMAGVLVAVGWVAARFRGLAERRGLTATWERRLGICGSLALTAIGVYLLVAA